MSGGREILAHWVGAQLTRADLVNAVVRAIEHRLPKDKAVSVGGVARVVSSRVTALAVLQEAQVLDALADALWNGVSEQRKQQHAQHERERHRRMLQQEQEQQEQIQAQKKVAALRAELAAAEAVVARRGSTEPQHAQLQAQQAAHVARLSHESGRSDHRTDHLKERTPQVVVPKTPPMPWMQHHPSAVDAVAAARQRDDSRKAPAARRQPSQEQRPPRPGARNPERALPRPPPGAYDEDGPASPPQPPPARRQQSRALPRPPPNEPMPPRLTPQESIEAIAASINRRGSHAFDTADAAAAAAAAASGASPPPPKRAGSNVFVLNQEAAPATGPHARSERLQRSPPPARRDPERALPQPGGRNPERALPRPPPGAYDDDGAPPPTPPSAVAKTPLGKDGRPLSPASAAIARAKAGEDLESLLADPTLNQGPSKLVACPSCGRNFAFDRLEKHLPICQKAKQSAKERGKWDGDARRRTEDAMAAERAATPPPGAYESAVRRRNEKQPGGVARNDAAKRGGGGNRGKTPPSTKGAAGRAVAAASAAAAGAPGGAAEILVLDEAPAPPPMLRKENSIWREDKGPTQAAVAPQLVGARVQAPPPLAPAAAPKPAASNAPPPQRAPTKASQQAPVSPSPPSSPPPQGTASPPTQRLLNQSKRAAAAPPPTLGVADSSASVASSVATNRDSQMSEVDQKRAAVRRQLGAKYVELEGDVGRKLTEKYGIRNGELTVKLPRKESAVAAGAPPAPPAASRSDVSEAISGGDPPAYVAEFTAAERKRWLELVDIGVLTGHDSHERVARYIGSMNKAAKATAAAQRKAEQARSNLHLQRKGADI